MRTPVLAWIFFIVTAGFTAVVVPLGEGFDEPYHLGYVQLVAQTGNLPVGPDSRLSVELDEFMSRHPIGWRFHQIYPALYSQEEYWQQPDVERREIDAAFRDLRFWGQYQDGASEFGKQYESHQAPLYYVLSAPVFLIGSKLFSFPDTFLLIRLWSALLASAVVPLSYLVAKEVSRSQAVANAVTMLVAMFPGIYPDVVRVSNDALAVPLMAAIFLALARYSGRRETLILSFLLLAGLSTKAIFIPILAAVVAVLLWWRERTAAMKLVMGTTLGWIWYIRNVWITGSVTGLPETVVANTSISSSLAALGMINWTDLFRLTAVSHIWMGNWSLLQYRSWIYETVFVLFVIGIAGFMAYLRKSKSRSVRAFIVIYVVFCASLVYYATQVFQQTSLSVIQGWYLSPLVPIEALAFVLGIHFLFGQRIMTWVVAFVALCFLAMLIYGTGFIAAPYYSGLTDHAPSGHLRAYHPDSGDASTMGARLTRLHAWLPISAPLYLALGVLASGFILICVFVKDVRWLSESSH